MIANSLLMRARIAICRILRLEPITFKSIRRFPETILIGGQDCGWMVPKSRIRVGMIAYCVGAGEDITFDVSLATEHGLVVHTFDPTPRAVSYVSSVLNEIGTVLNFHPWGVWSKDEIKQFWEPQCRSHVSHSIVNLQKTDRYFEAQCRSISSIMEELGHRIVDLVKLDIEGAEYVVLENLLATSFRPSILLVEFDEWHHPLDRFALTRMSKMINRLLESGYKIFYVKAGNYCFALNF